jgi:transcription elongation GreA/GreB family factor
MTLHAAARQRREAAALGSDEYRAAAEEVARIEIQIALIEEPPPAAG